MWSRNPVGAGAASCGRRPLTAALLLLLPPGGVTPDAPFSQPDPRSTRREGPQGVASTPHLPEALLTLFPPDPSASRLHPVVQLPCFLLGGLPGTPQPAAPPRPPAACAPAPPGEAGATQNGLGARLGSRALLLAVTL